MRVHIGRALLGVILALAVLLACVVGYARNRGAIENVLYGQPQEEDFRESKEVIAILKAQREWADDEISAPNFNVRVASHRLLRSPMEIYVIGVTDPTEQDSLLPPLRQWQQQKVTKPFDIVFYARQGFDPPLRRVHIVPPDV